MLKNYIEDVVKDMSKSEEKRLDAAARLVVREMKRAVSKRVHSSPGMPPGKLSGDLQKGIGSKKLEHVRIVGVGPPAFHAHLLEFGTHHRIVKNSFGREGVQADAGRVLPRPFVFPTFEKTAPAVQEVLSNPWM